MSRMGRKLTSAEAAVCRARTIVIRPKWKCDFGLKSHVSTAIPPLRMKFAHQHEVIGRPEGLLVSNERVDFYGRPCRVRDAIPNLSVGNDCEGGYALTVLSTGELNRCNGIFTSVRPIRKPIRITDCCD